MARLMRFYGFQRIAAALLSGALTWLAVHVLGSTPPAYWDEWPLRASLALVNLVSGSLGLAFCGWLFLILRPLFSRDDAIGFGAKFLFGLTIFGGVGGGWQCLVGGFYLLTGEPGCAVPLFGEWMRAVGWPLLIGSVPVALLELYERAIVNPDLRRWLTSGQGHAATWIRASELQRMSEPLSNSADDGTGHLEKY